VDSLILIDALGFPQIVHLPLQLNILRVPVLSHLVLHLVPARSLARSALRSGMYRRERVTNKQVCRFAQFINNVEGGHDSLVRTIQQIRTPEAVELSARIPEIRIPTLIVWGSHDSLLSPDQAELLHRALPAARPVVFVETGHLAHQELPEDTAKLIEEFLVQGPTRTFHEAQKAVRFGS
jgi:pimeloyl-ACP methyl ester carboxylesterase